MQDDNTADGYFIITIASRDQVRVLPFLKNSYRLFPLQCSDEFKTSHREPLCLPNECVQMQLLAVALCMDSSTKIL